MDLCVYKDDIVVVLANNDNIVISTNLESYSFHIQSFNRFLIQDIFFCKGIINGTNEVNEKDIFSIVQKDKKLVAELNNGEVIEIDHNKNEMILLSISEIKEFDLICENIEKTICDYR